MRFTHKSFDALTLHELYELMCLRDDVFVVGQKVTSEPEIDGLDPLCVHVMGRDDGGRIVATARLFVHEDPVKVGRVAVARDLQGQGIGSRLMAYVHEVLGERPAAMHAQAHLESWYTRLGWTAVGDVFDEAEIPHRHMVRPDIRP
ncbi:MAG: GNAT family N-acetyltransferase [Myxococcota bacterium]